MSFKYDQRRKKEAVLRLGRSWRNLFYCSSLFTTWKTGLKWRHWWNINTVVLAFCNIHLLFGCNSCTTGFMFHDFGHPRKILEWGIWDAASGWDLANTSKNAEIISTRTVKKSPVISKKLLLLLANWRWCWRCWCLINQKLTSASLATCQLQETWLWGNGILLISSSA